MSHAEPHPQPAPLPEQVVALLADREGTIWLDGGDEDAWSIVVWSPDETSRNGSDWVETGRRYTGARPGAEELPFLSGCVGYIGYGASHAVVPVPPDAPTWEPEVWLGRYPGALLFHHPTGRWHATGSSDRQREARALLDRARPLPVPAAPCAASMRTVARQTHLERVRRIQAWIAEGDHYQLNLTRCVHLDGAGDAWSAYRRLRGASRPSRGAFLVLEDGLRILSNSPERLLDVRGRDAETEPIKGTRPRHTDARADAQAAAELARHDKEIAELTMIVDLCRNDLGRVARVGSVAVGPRTLTAHANVHHASQVVRAELSEGKDAWNALAALFPPGSVTGAPKLRALQRIRELEDTPRGVYCGAIGHASSHGRSAWSVAIRTAVFHGQEARFHVGGGIVADSVPEAEWDETLSKGTLLATALAGRLERDTPDQ